MPSEQPLALVGSVIFFMRCSSGAKSSTEERMPAGSSPLSRRASKPEWSTTMRPAARSQVMREPCSVKKFTSFSTSVMFGTWRSVTGASVRSVAHRMGSTEFLLPEGVMVPLRGLPPWMMRSAMKKA